MAAAQKAETGGLLTEALLHGHSVHRCSGFLHSLRYISCV